jgi:hypothetical protein
MKMDVECGLSEPFVECGRGEGSFSGRKCSSTFYARRLRAPCSPIGVAVFEEALRSLLSKDGPDADKRGNLPAGICPIPPISWGDTLSGEPSLGLNGGVRSCRFGPQPSDREDFVRERCRNPFFRLSSHARARVASTGY